MHQIIATLIACMIGVGGGLAGCTRTCRNGTVLVTLDYGPFVSQLDEVDIRVTIDGATQSFRKSRRSPHSSTDGLEIEFVAYPAGRAITVQAHGFKSAVEVAAGESSTLLVDGCTPLSLSFVATAGDGGSCTQPPDFGTTPFLATGFEENDPLNEWSGVGSTRSVTRAEPHSGCTAARACATSGAIYHTLNSFPRAGASGGTSYRASGYVRLESSYPGGRVRIVLRSTTMGGSNDTGSNEFAPTGSGWQFVTSPPITPAAGSRIDVYFSLEHNAAIDGWPELGSSDCFSVDDVSVDPM